MSRSLFNPLTALDDISRVTSVKILGVTITNKLLAVSDHILHVIVSCVSMLHALSVYCVIMA